MNKWILVSIVSVLILLFPLYQLYALNNVGISSYEINNIAMDKTLLFTVQGKIFVTNPSLISVTIREVPYVGYIDGQEVFSGSLDGQHIAAGTTAAFAFDQEIDWVPDTATALAVLNGKNITVTIHVEPQVAYLSFFTLHSEKEISFSISDMIKPYIQQQIASISSMIGKFLG